MPRCAALCTQFECMLRDSQAEGDACRERMKELGERGRGREAGDCGWGRVDMCDTCGGVCFNDLRRALVCAACPSRPLSCLLPCGAPDVTPPPLPSPPRPPAQPPRPPPHWAGRSWRLSAR